MLDKVKINSGGAAMSCVHASLLRSVEQHLALTGMSPSGFGRKIAGDPRLVFDLRKGRKPKEEMKNKLIEETRRCEKFLEIGEQQGRYQGANSGCTQ
ncbi:MAG: hypothetical protein PVF65_07765 [Sphingomonadales bacterium]